MVSPSKQREPLSQRVRCRPRIEMLEERNLLTFYGGYYTVDELQAITQWFGSTYPNIAQVVDYGDSYSKQVGGVTTPRGERINGYDLLALRITNRAIPGPKPVAIIMTGLHAREIASPEIGWRFSYLMTAYYGIDPDITWMVDHHEIWVLTESNPDGHWYVERGGNNPWLWRKNGRPGCTTYPPSGGTSYGIDLNRNFADHWGGVGASTQPCNETYRGASVASEPETQAVQNLVRTLIPDQRGPSDSDPAPDNTTGIFIDIHTYGGYVLWPWGHTSAAPPNSTGLSNIGRKLASYNGYTAGQSNQTLYATTGTSNGWVYTELGAPGFTIEMRGTSFLPAYSYIDSTLWLDMYQPLLYSVRTARAPYQLARGPDARTGWAWVSGNLLYTYSDLDDRQNGNQAINAGEWYLDTPPWAPGATANPMYALDGTFNTPLEASYGYSSVTGITPGRHTVYMRGRDVGGNWGPVSAAFVTIGSSPGPGEGDPGLVPVLLIGTAPDALLPGQSLPLPLTPSEDDLPAPVAQPVAAPAVNPEATMTPAPTKQTVDSLFTLEMAPFGEF